jgi:hypothetical protein
VAIGLLAAAWLPSTQAADSVAGAAVCTTDAAQDGSSVKAVSYTTGQAGHKLKWLPYRPTKAEVKNASCSATTRQDGERLAQYASPVVPKPATSGAVDPFDDPFGDSKAGAKPLVLGTRLGDEAPQSPAAEPLDSALPEEIVIEEPTPESDLLKRAEEEESVIAAVVEPEDPCASVRLTPINQISYDISASDEMFPKHCPLTVGEPPDRWKHGWAPITFTWKASALCHKPAYFEQVHLERYGHSCGPYLQPVISGAHFFLTVPVLPYKMGLYPPNECIYTLGYYRAGSCAPYMLDPLPLSVRAGLFEAAAWTGAAFLIP